MCNVGHEDILFSLFDWLIPKLHECPDSGRSCVELIHFMVLNDLPEAAVVRVCRDTFELTALKVVNRQYYKCYARFNENLLSYLLTVYKQRILKEIVLFSRAMQFACKKKV